MNPFGIIPKCPTCDTNVYAAEQVLGPGRRMYHKSCLKCTSCAKVLTPGQFLEHDFEPFCQPCHLRDHSTQDLRFANVLPPSPVRRARLSPASTPPPPIRVTRLTEENDAIDEEDEDQEVHSSGREPSPDDKSEQTQRDEIRNHLTGEDSSPLEDAIPRTRSPSPTKLEASPAPSLTSRTSLRPSESPLRTYSARTGSIQFMESNETGLSTASVPTGFIRSNVTGSPVRTVRHSFTGTTAASTGTAGRRHTYTPPGFSGTPSCPRCDKLVYFAEQVKACGKTWHKFCLRCSECSTLLDPGRVNDRDGVVLCRNCYSKLHGPIGLGYGLIGKIS